MGRIEELAKRYERFISLPWQKDLSGAERSIFVVYDMKYERRIRAKKMVFELATKDAGHGWLKCDLTSVFAEWMVGLEYKESYFESPEIIAHTLESDFLAHVAEHLRTTLTASAADENSVVGVFGIASLFGLVRVSELMSKIEPDIRGRLVVFFPGEYENNNYRLLDARDGWNYLAVPITMREG